MTWKKFLPEYKINILDFETAYQYIGETLFEKIICKNLSIMVQTDAIRVAILNKYGGIWIDADTIILNDKIIQQFKNYELGMIWEEKKNFHHIAFIHASRHSIILKEWLKKIILKVQKCKQIVSNKDINNNITKNKRELEKLFFYDYLGNSIIDNIIYNKNKKYIFRIDINKANVFPDFKYFEKNNSITRSCKYRSFYFSKRDPRIILNYTKGIVFLHNSWTPVKYKKLSEEEILKEDILISKLFVNLLKK